MTRFVEAAHPSQSRIREKHLTVSRSYDDKSLAIGGRNIIVRRVIAAVARTLAEETTEANGN